jgi:hypothetical protein
MSDSSEVEGVTAPVERTPYKPGEAPDSQSLQKNLSLPVGKGEVMPVEIAKWERLKGRVENLDKRWSVNWLSTGASASASIAVSAAIAAIAIPTGGESEIDPVVQAALFIVAGAALLLAGVFLIFFFLEKSGRTLEGSDIVDEMETEEDAWEQRGTSDR